MSTTILARTDQGPVRPRGRVTVKMPTTSSKGPRRSRKDRREARRISRSQDAGTIVNPRVIDVQVRSAIMWPRSYR